jgi:hypothetical protein
MFVLVTTNCYLGGAAFPSSSPPSGLGYFLAGAVLEIPGNWFDEQTMTRLGPLPPANSPQGLLNPWSALIQPWSSISPGSPPLNQE